MKKNTLIKSTSYIILSITYFAASFLMGMVVVGATIATPGVVLLSFVAAFILGFLLLGCVSGYFNYPKLLGLASIFCGMVITGFIFFAPDGMSLETWTLILGGTGVLFLGAFSGYLITDRLSKKQHDIAA